MRMLVGALAALIVMPACAHCFSSDYGVSAERERAEAVAAVFVAEGRFVKAANDEVDDTVRYSVEVLDQWKGNLPPRIVVASENNSGRFPMEIGQTYVVFLQRDGEAWSVDNCGNSSLLNPESDLMRALGTFVKPRSVPAP